MIFQAIASFPLCLLFRQNTDADYAFPRDLRRRRLPVSRNDPYRRGSATLAQIRSIWHLLLEAARLFPLPSTADLPAMIASFTADIAGDASSLPTALLSRERLACRIMQEPHVDSLPGAMRDFFPRIAAPMLASGALPEVTFPFHDIYAITLAIFRSPTGRHAAGD